MNEKRNEGRVRSIDVARLAGVSRSAVSRTFTPNTYVSEATRAKVIKAANALNYHPNAMARSLITRRSGIIGIISGSLQNPYLAQILESLGTTLRKAGLAPLVLFGDNVEDAAEFAQIVSSYQVDALVMTNEMLSSALTDKISQTKLPAVAVNRYFPQEWITSITCNNLEGAGLVADHLLDNGATRIAIVTGKNDSASSRDREAGFLRALVRRGKAPIAIESGDYTRESGVQAARKLLTGRPLPDAVFCGNDLMATGFMDVAQNELGIRIPDDLLVAGFDNSVVGSWQSYGLTTVDQNVEEMVALAVDYIQRALQGNGEEVEKHFQVPGKLIVRNSTTRLNATETKSSVSRVSAFDEGFPR